MDSRGIPSSVWALEPGVKAIILAAPRVGAHFLLHALGNHPQIYAARDEPLSRNSMVNSLFGRAIVGPEGAMLSVWRQRGYDVGILKVAYRWFRPEIVEVMKKYDARVIHLKRDIPASIVSFMIYEMARRGEIEHISHSTKPVIGVRVALDPIVFVGLCKQLKSERDNITSLLDEHGFPTLTIDYEEMIDNQCVRWQITTQLNKFLGVDERPFCCRLQKVNNPPGDTVTNWSEIVEALQAASFAAEKV